MMDLHKFFATAWERHHIYVLKELGMPKPWTKNPIFLDNFFCNVFRDLDKTSVFIRKVINENENNPDLWKLIIMMRYISRLGTLETLYDLGLLKGDIGTQQALHNYLRNARSRGVKLFTSAFIVNSRARGVWKDKVSYMFSLLKEIYYVFDCRPDEIIQGLSKLEDSYNRLYGLPGVGPFMAYQFTIDFSYSQRYLANVEDEQTWTALGLGAIRGMNRLLGNPPTKNKIEKSGAKARGILYAWILEVLSGLNTEVARTVKLTGPNLRYDVEELYEPFRNLKLCDVQHWLCEYDKYMRGGSKKRGYLGRE